MDFLGPLLKTKKGNTHLLLIVDRFTKLVRAVPMKKTTAFDVAQAFAANWVFVYGPPSSVLMDNAGNFRAKFMLEVHRRLGITSKATTTYHPQTNGQVERHNRTILAALRKYVGDHPSDWDEYTDALTYGYNSHVHSSTGFTPFELVLSRTPAPLSVEPQSKAAAKTPRETRMKWLEKVTQATKLARERIAAAQKRTKTNFDTHTRPALNESNQAIMSICDGRRITHQLVKGTNWQLPRMDHIR